MRRWLALLLLVAGGAGAQTGDFRFAILGDRTGRATPGIYERIWKAVDAARPAFVINVGDTIEGKNDATAAAEWRQVRRVWDRYRYPLYFTAGNHDIWNAGSRRLFEKVTGRPATYSFDWGAAHFTVLDNSSSLELPREQLEFLERDLEANRARAPKFVFFHQPFWLVPLTLGSGEFPLHRLGRKYGVSFVISGHVHRLIRMERDGIVYLTLGSSGASIDRGTSRGEGRAEGWFYQHMLVTVKDGKATLDVKALE